MSLCNLDNMDFALIIGSCQFSNALVVSCYQLLEKMFAFTDALVVSCY